MSSHYFGFDDDETANISDLKKVTSAPKRIEVRESTPEKLTISQIQALLSQDLSANDSTLESTTNDTSIFIDEQDYNTTTDTLTETVREDEFYQDESSAVNEKPEKIPRKVLGDIENKTQKPSKTYKKPAQPVISKKVLQNTKLPKKRKARKNNENENYDKFAEQINKQFAQVDSFELVVE